MLSLRQLTLSVVCAALFTLSIPVANCPAESRTWNGPADGEWFTGSYWNPTGGPDIFDDLSIFSSSPQTMSQVTTDNDGSITLDGSSTSASFRRLYVAENGTAEMYIQNNAYLSNVFGHIGYNSGSEGTVTITGAGSTWNNHQELYIGYYGTGTLNIKDGGSVLSENDYLGYYSGSDGTITVTGAGSTWNSSGSSADMCIGYYGAGTLNIKDGGSVSIPYSRIGCYSGSTSTVTVSGAGSTWTNSSGAVIVGQGGVGMLNVTNGGSVSSNGGDLGYESGSTGTVTVTGAGSTWESSSDICNLCVGRYGTGTLNITDGGSVTNTDGCIGEFIGSTGTVNVSGEGSTWTNSHSLYIGLHGTGTLNITNGGSVTNGPNSLMGWGDGASGTVTVSGAGSTWTNSGYLYFGNIGTGTLNIINGGSVTNTESRIGWYNSGTVNISGAGSTWTNSGWLHVGHYGTGTLNITNGGSVSSDWGYIGDYSGSTGTVTVADNGSTWTNNGYLYLGRYGGNGTLNITNGGSVSNTEGYIGFHSNSTSIVTVTGSGSTWTNSSELHVGYYGTGTLNITKGGSVSNTNGYLGRCQGMVTVDGTGSTWNNTGSLYLGGDDTNPLGTGSVAVRHNGLLEVGGTLKVWGPGTLNIGATGKATVGEALVLLQDSTLTAEAGATIRMTGSAFENASTNSANLAGLGNLKMIFEGGSGVVDPFEAAGEDVGAVAGGFVEANFLLDTLQLGGTAAGKIQLVDDFDNQDDGIGVGEAAYVNNLIMNAGATIDLNDLNLYYLNGGGPKQFFCGDANLEGNVDDSDLSILLSNFGDSGAWSAGDFNGDGNIGDADLSILLSNFGSTSTTSMAVPEPTTASLLLLGAVAMLQRRKK